MANISTTTVNKASDLSGKPIKILIPLKDELS